MKRVISVSNNIDTIKLIASCKLPVKFALGTEVEMMCFDYGEKRNEILVLMHKGIDFTQNSIPLVRIHSACITGEIFCSEKCDCGPQFHLAMEKICSSSYGLMFYMTSHEGRGIGIENKIRAYKLQENGINTIEANELLGFPHDARDFQSAIAVLKFLKIDAIKLLTNNPDKVSALKKGGIKIIQQIAIASTVNSHNRDYLLLKQNVLKHNFGKVLS